MYDINVIGNAPVDMLTHVPESFISEHNLNKGDFNQVDSATFDAITQKCTVEEMQSGGSCANSAWALAKIGKNVHFTGHIGNDAAGQHFYTDMEAVGITMPAPQQGSRTMEIYVLITPDGERTFVSQGVTAPITAEMIHEETFQQSPWLFIEGYTLLDQEPAVLKAIDLAKQNQCKIAFTVSADFVIHIKQQDIFSDILPHIDLFLANEEEYALLQEYIEKLPETEQKQAKEQLNNMAQVVTHSEKGATFKNAEGEQFIPTTAVQTVDATGAGDAFAAGFLSKYLDHDVENGLKTGHQIAGLVVQQVGARLKNWQSYNQQKIA